MKNVIIQQKTGSLLLTIYGMAAMVMKRINDVYTVINYSKETQKSKVNFAIENVMDYGEVKIVLEKTHQTTKTGNAMKDYYLEQERHLRSGEKLFFKGIITLARNAEIIVVAILKLITLNLSPNLLSCDTTLIMA